MTKIFFRSILAICLLISAGTVVSGQLASSIVKPSEKFIVLNKTENANSTGLAGRVNPPVIRSFLRTYKDVSDEKWIGVKEGFVAMFTLNDIDYQVAYTRKGNLLRTIRSYNEDKMALELRHIVKSTYYDYEINRVHEIETPRDPVAYVIQLIGKREVINLGLFDGDMEELEKFNRSN